MSTRDAFVRRLALALVVTSIGACSDDAMTSFPEEDASDQDAPTFDIPATDTGADTGTADRGTATDNPVSRDRGTSETTVCPASCSASAECDPCRTSDTPSTVQYCCISGLCVSMTGTCPTITDGGPGDATGDGPSDAAGDGAAADGADPTDDMPDEPDAGSPPADVTAASDLGGDARADGAATTDRGAVDASTPADATTAMDATDGGG
jgi:hypothetical protein